MTWRNGMQVKFSGSIHYANSAPVSNVVVHIYDKDAAGKQDDDLTVLPGRSDEQGRFNLTYEPLRYVDYHIINVSGTPEEPFNTTDSGSGLRLPDLGDIYLPYLKFSYIFNGYSRQHTAPMRIFQTRFLLPENPQIVFFPSTHGFNFPNSFSGYFLPFSTPAFMRSRKVTGRYGLCGGMCAAAYDFALAGRTIPHTLDIPHQGTRLQRYLFQRQMDSWGGMGKMLVKVAQWTGLPDSTLLGAHARTADEFNSFRHKLDDNNLVILALIYEHASSVKELSRRIFNNHQVLAYSYQLYDSGGVAINIYDPNLPGRDDVVIHSEPVVVGEITTLKGSQIAMGLKSTQLLGGEFYRQVRGFFAMPYEPVKPPKRL